MTNKPVFIQVILPLRLEWEPYYVIEDGLPVSVGERVEAVLSGRRYIGVVSAVDVQPPADVKRILPASRIALPPIGERELAFWRAIADYYLCGVGEVYKAAYPQQKQDSEEVAVRMQERLEKRLAVLLEKEQKARKDSTREEYRRQIQRIQALLAGEADTAPSSGNTWEESRKTVLLKGGAAKFPLYMEQVRLTLSQGKSVLYLVPDIALSRQLEDAVESYFPQLMTYHSALSPARRRAVADYVRKTPASLVLGTRSALFLPHGNLGLVIVDQEHDISHKQDSPAPRYHARESAILLAGIHGAHVVLGSETPSLESVYNTETGRYQGVDLQDFSPCEVLLVHMSAEARKKGMLGSFSLKLLEQMHRAREAGKKVLLVCRSKAAIPEYEQELKAVLGPETKGIVLASPASARGLAAGSFGVVGILQADTVLAREDFRCDEKAVQALRMLMDRCTPDGILVIQTRESAHPVFREFTGDCSAHLLEERRQFGYPPYTRLVQLVLKDVSDKRRSFMAAELVRELRQVLPQEVNVVGPYTSPVNALETHIRLFLPRNKALLTCKKAVYNTFVSFEKNRKYTGHIHIDVDPV